MLNDDDDDDKAGRDALDTPWGLMVGVGIASGLWILIAHGILLLW